MMQLPDDSLADTIRSHLQQLLVARGTGNSISLAEIAQVIADQIGSNWQELMRPVRTVAAALADQGVIDVIQDDTQVNISVVRGPVRLRLRPTAVAMNLRDDPTPGRVG